MNEIQSTLATKLIYIFSIPDKEHEGYLKIGEATVNEDCDVTQLTPNCDILNQSAKKRINQYTNTIGVHYNLLHTECTICTIKGKITNFHDKDVHRVLENSGIKRATHLGNAKEWYKVDLQTAINAILEVKKGNNQLPNSKISQNKTPISFRKEQLSAIALAKNKFNKGGNKVLWNAKMRFGKTLTALQLFKELCQQHSEYKRMLIITHKPVVNEGWFEDFKKIFWEDNTTFGYGSKKNASIESLEKQLKKSETGEQSLFGNDNKITHYVYFASIQDLRGSAEVGGKFNKNDIIFKTVWDLIVIDEAHEGTQTDLGKKVYESLTKDKNGNDKPTKVLSLSGTPFNIVKDYDEDEVFTWSYVDEQKEKLQWELEHEGDSNPYADLPHMNMYTYDLGGNFDEFQNSGLCFNFSEFFRVTTDSTIEDARFYYEDKVLDFLNLLTEKSNTSNYPFSTDKYRFYFRHTFWLVPGVLEALALQQLLEKHPIFQMFKIINVAGEGDKYLESEEDIVTDDFLTKDRDALEKVKNGIANNEYTITLSCGKLTTGVTIPEWTAVFMLYGSTNVSVATYMQAMFRVQSPGNIDGLQKTESYVFDFAPDRALVLMSRVTKANTKPGKTKEKDRLELGELLNFFPIIAISGSETRFYDVDQLLIRLKHTYIERVVASGFDNNDLYNDKLLNLDDLELKTFEELRGIIGETPSQDSGNTISINYNGFDEEERETKGSNKPKRKLTPEEKEELKRKRKKMEERRSAISILRGISIRMPMLIYGTELKDGEEVNLDNFTDLIDADSWKEFMPKGVTKQWFNKIKQYYDPEIFLESGRIIREKTKNADDYGIIERIRKIVDIFNTFKNPDKETVLTPWRVVNMQITDTLGGYDFYDKKHEGRLDEPRFVDNGSVTNRVYQDSQTRILEINSKSGLYPLFMAYSVYKERCKEFERRGFYDISQMNLQDQLDTWDRVLKENIFVVCKTKMAVSITKRTLSGFRKSYANAECFENLVETLKTEPETFINKVINGKKYWKVNQDQNMKFNAIVGNPPYQEMDGGGTGSSAIPLYNKFVDIAKNINPNYISMIMPARWYTGGRGLDTFRTSMLNDNRIKFIADFEDSRLCFPSVDIAGGICYFLWDKNYHGDCKFVNVTKNSRYEVFRKLNESEVFVRSIQALKIIHIVQSQHKNFFDEVVYSSNPFGFRSFYDGEEKEFPNSIKLFGSRGITYVKKEEIKTNLDIIDKYKVIMSKASAEHAGQTDKEGKKRMISRLEVLEPNVICSESYLVLCVFDNKEEAENAKSYFKTIFVRFLLSTILLTQNIAKDKFCFIPVQDFTEPWDDLKLYKKYNLTEEEINYIESLIKPMDSINVDETGQTEMDV